MLEQLADYFISKPTRLILLGHLLFRISSAAVVVGLIGRVAVVGASALASFGGHPSGGVTLAGLYPNLPTWWVPESTLGFVATSVIGVAGLALVHIGKTWSRLLR